MNSTLPEPDPGQVPSRLPYRNPFGYKLSHDCDEGVFFM